MVNLASPDFYINRELSILDFNRRVLAQAHDASLPLLERIRFLCISCSNLDEFFEIRVAGLQQRQHVGSVQAGLDGMGVVEQLKAIRQQAVTLVKDQYELLNQLVLPGLAAQGIRFVNTRNFTDPQREWLADYFAQQVEPVLTPLSLDPARPFPRIQNKSLNFIVRLAGRDAFGRDAGLAVVQVPRALPRVVRLPANFDTDGANCFAFLSMVVATFVEFLFIGMAVTGCWQFRVTRNSDLFVDDEEVEDLMLAVEGELAHRRYGDAVRLETSVDCPDDITNFLLKHFELDQDDLYQVDGPVNLNRLMTIYDLVDRPELKYPTFAAGLPASLNAKEDIFAAIRDGDILLHHPFQSFLPVVDFVRQAGADKDVLAIKQTLYRAGPDSPIVDALVRAANAGKEVTVIIELMARFDEADNINLATRLQEAGAHVMYGVVGYKTHAKLIMVVRRERNKLRRYCHLGTGNYHPNTARSYTDYGLLTCNAALGDDLHQLFLQLTSPTRPAQLQRLLQSPFTLHAALIEKTKREIEHAQQGKPARIIVKINALIEPKLIQTLYEASIAGVKIDLIVRGICALKPGVPGISENITVRSIIGRFLEHSRVYYFHNGGRPEVFCASADWMERNFFRRIEVCFPIESKTIRERIIDDLELYLRDNANAWQLQADGTYVRVAPDDGMQSSETRPEIRIDAQADLLGRLNAAAALSVVAIENQKSIET